MICMISCNFASDCAVLIVVYCLLWRQTDLIYGAIDFCPSVGRSVRLELRTIASGCVESSFVWMKNNVVGCFTGTSHELLKGWDSLWSFGFHSILICNVPNLKARKNCSDKQIVNNSVLLKLGKHPHNCKVDGNWHNNENPHRVSRSTCTPQVTVLFHSTAEILGVFLVASVSWTMPNIAIFWHPQLNYSHYALWIPTNSAGISQRKEPDQKHHRITVPNGQWKSVWKVLWAALDPPHQIFPTVNKAKPHCHLQKLRQCKPRRLKGPPLCGHCRFGLLIRFSSRHLQK